MEEFSRRCIAQSPGDFFLKAYRQPVAIKSNNKVIVVALCIEDYKKMIGGTVSKETLIPASTFHRQAKGVIDAALKGPVVLTKKTKPYIVLVSLEHYQKL